MAPIGWPEVITLIIWVAIVAAAIWLFRAARDEERMTEPRRLLIVIGATAIVLFLFISEWSPLRSSTEYVSEMEGAPHVEFICNGATNAWDQATTSDRAPACGAWGVAILNDELDYPEGVEAASIKRLEMGQALWGLLDRCTATAYVRRTSFEQEVPCWDDSLSEPNPDS